jgi:enterochelin esterase-like enzyme
MRILARLIACAALALPLSVTAQAPRGSPDRSLPWVTDQVSAPRVVFRTFDSAYVGGKVSYHAYVPAAHAATDARMPVLYWLHGTAGGTAGIRPLAQFFDAAIEANRLPPMIVVFVNGLPRRLWADAKDGSSPVETVFVREVIPDVDRTFRTIAAREGRIVEGFSMGGYGAARLGLRHLDLFAGISILAGGPLDLELRGPRAQNNLPLREQLLRDVCGNDIDYFRAISPRTAAEAASAALRDKPMVIRHLVGTLDNTRDLNRQFHEHMAELQIAHEYRELPGVGHDARALLAALGEANGEFYRRALGQASAAPAR